MERKQSIIWIAMAFCHSAKIADAFQCYKCEYSQIGDGAAVDSYCQDTFGLEEFQGQFVECETQCFKYKMSEGGGQRYITRRGCFSSALKLGDSCSEGAADNKQLHIKLNCCQSDAGPCNASATISATLRATLTMLTLGLYYLLTE